MLYVADSGVLRLFACWCHETRIGSWNCSLFAFFVVLLMRMTGVLMVGDSMSGNPRSQETHCVCCLICREMMEMEHL